MYESDVRFGVSGLFQGWGLGIIGFVMRLGTTHRFQGFLGVVEVLRSIPDMSWHVPADYPRTCSANAVCNFFNL